MAKILIVDDHQIIRIGVRIVLEKAGHEVIAEMSKGSDAISFMSRFAPDLVILDLDLPDLDGFHVLHKLRGKTRIIIFSGLNADTYSNRCSRTGASSFISKGGDMNELLTAVNLVLSGYKLFPTISTSSVHSSSCNLSEAALISKLSNRELTVLRKLSQGYRIKDIARDLIVSIKTVSTYKARLLAKLNASNIIELVELAKRNVL